jgi:hypothetical protein
MKALDEFKKLRKQQAEDKKKHEKIFEADAKVSERIHNLIRKIVKEDKLLSKAPWDLIISNDGDLQLHAYAKDFPELAELFEGEWGIRLYLSDFSFSEHDGAMYITIKDNKDAIKVLDEYGIKVNKSYLTQKKNSLLFAVQLIDKVLEKF